MVLAGVINVVPPYHVVHANGGGNVGSVLYDRVGWRRYQCDDAMLERLEIV